MMSQEKLTVALVLALISNATLLLLLLLKSSDIGSVFCDDLHNDAQAISDPQSSKFGSNQVGKNGYQQGVRSNNKNVLHHEPTETSSSFSDDGRSSDENVILHLLKMKPTGFHNSRIETLLQQYRDVIANLHITDSFGNRHQSTSDFIRQLNQRASSGSDSDSAMTELLRGSILRKPALHTLLREPASNQGSLKPVDDSVATTALDFSTTSQHNDISEKVSSKSGHGIISDSHNQSASVPLQHSAANSKRERRHAYVDPSGEAVVTDTTTGGSTGYKLDTIFSQLTDKELSQFGPAVSDVLLPALFHFEGIIISEIEQLHNTMVAQDLRLEELELTMLNIAKRNALEPQADAVDNKSVLDNLQHVLGDDEGFMNAGNISETLQLDIDGSGEAELDIATTPPPQPTTSTQSVAFYDLYRLFSSMEQKVMALENYNVMSDSELTRVRSEVAKMDDKTTEMDRRQRNMQIRTSMHTYKITELEMMMSKSEMGIHSALDAYSRVNSRLEAFKDRLSDFKNDLHSVAVQFTRHDQIANELRAADSYKAHDIQEMRKTVFGLESRLNGLYRVLDQNVDSVRNDLRSMLDRLCFNNQLSC